MPSWPDQFVAVLRDQQWSDEEIDEVMTAVRAQCARTERGPRREFGDAES